MNVALLTARAARGSVKGEIIGQISRRRPCMIRRNHVCPIALAKDRASPATAASLLEEPLKRRMILSEAAHDPVAAHPASSAGGRLFPDHALP
jgi:hypothetical protein